MAKKPAEMYESLFVPGIFTPLSRVLVELAAPRSGERVLDLACGTGIVARQVAPLVGTTGSVVALDLRPGMLAVARSLTPPQGATIDWKEGDAVSPALPDGSFDLVLCQQGLQFFEDRVGALRHAYRMLTASGRLVAAVWQGLSQHPVFECMAEAEARHLGALGVDAADSNMPFSLGSAEELRALLNQAGFERVDTVAKSIGVRFPSPESFVENTAAAYAAVMPQFLEDPTAFSRFVDAVTRDMRAFLADYREGDHLAFPMHTHIAIASR